MSDEQQRKMYSIRLITTGLAGAWLANQDNVTNSINEAIILMATKYGTGDVITSIPSYIAKLEQLNLEQQNEIKMLHQALAAGNLATKLANKTDFLTPTNNQDIHTHGQHKVSGPTSGTMDLGFISEH